MKLIIITLSIISFFWYRRYQRNITCKKCGRKFHNQSNWRIKYPLFSKSYRNNVCNQCANEEIYLKNR